MAPRTKQQLKELKESRRESILTAALKVFSADGYDGATISQIAKEAGMSKGLLYTYFESKEELLDELLNYGLNRMGEYLTFIPEKGITTKKEFNNALRDTIGLYAKQQEFWRLYMIVILQKEISKKFEQTMQGFMQEYLGIFATYFQKKGVANPIAEAILLGSILDGMMMGLSIAPEMYPMDDIINLIEKKFG